MEKIFSRKVCIRGEEKFLGGKVDVQREEKFSGGKVGVRHEEKISGGKVGIRREEKFRAARSAFGGIKKIAPCVGAFFCKNIYDSRSTERAMSIRFPPNSISTVR